MSDFTFVTSNEHKALTARIICDRYDVKFDSEDLDIVEIQDDDGEVIAADKARQAFKACSSPVVVNDTTWIIPGLNGWPGPYMKQMNTWLTPEDFVRLTANLEDRRIIQRSILAYKDADQEKIFSVDMEGILLKEPRGASRYTNFTVTSFNNGKTSFAEDSADGYTDYTKRQSAWDELCQWLQKSKA